MSNENTIFGIPAEMNPNFAICGAMRDPKRPPREQIAKQVALMSVGNISPV